ncbi:MAG: single-stranded DNA-binding protein [Actinomycetaceae bacterium]|nr:single-stranded DNA-binding protein [Actinomycetaceae bacterium]MDY5854521.1 single-stranded DNA-binding protein [Arcanobacterium sp.]
MANDTVISVRGWAGCDPTIYKNENPDSGEDLQLSSAIFTLGVTPRMYNKRSHAYENGATTWYSVRCYGSLAVNVGKSVRRGAPLLVRGRLITRSFTDKQGTDRSVQQIVADSVAIDLNFMVAAYAKSSDELRNVAAVSAPVAAHSSTVSRLESNTMIEGSEILTHGGEEMNVEDIDQELKNLQRQEEAIGA